MGRPNLADVRTSEILDAFSRCVARYGLAGSSLERIAEESGMKRSLLRHYVGNRDALVQALAERTVDRYRSELDRFVEAVEPSRRTEQLLDFLVPRQARATTESVLVAEAFIAAGEDYPDAAKLMSDYVDELVNAIALQLHAQFPQQTKQRCWSIAYGMTGVCFNHESLVPLGLPAKYAKAARVCIQTLVESLRDA